jgi:hypothetical protein
MVWPGTAWCSNWVQVFGHLLGCLVLLEAGVAAYAANQMQYLRRNRCGVGHAGAVVMPHAIADGRQKACPVQPLRSVVQAMMCSITDMAGFPLTSLASVPQGLGLPPRSRVCRHGNRYLLIILIGAPPPGCILYTHHVISKSELDMGRLHLLL